MNFIPDQPKQASDVPYFDEVTKDAGWQGHTTSKSIETLKAEITASIGRLGGMVTGFQRGTFQVNNKKRDGFQLHYVIEAADGKMLRGRIDIAALPVEDTYDRRRSWESRRERSLKMALYMLRMALDGTWFLQQLSPGYSALMPWMLYSDGKTITEHWAESPVMSNLLPPPPDEDFVDGEVRDAE